MTSTRTTAAGAALAVALSFTTTACGGSDGADDGTAAPVEQDDATDSTSDGGFGGAGLWTAEQLCELSTPDAVGGAFGVDVVERPGGGGIDGLTACSWDDAGDPLGPSVMSLNQYDGFASDGLGADEDVDVPGAEMAGFSENIGGAANLSVVVGDQMLQITFPVGTVGAKEFGSVIASVWVAQQSG